MKTEIKIGLAGFGTVGSGVYKHLTRNAALLEERTGVTFSVTRVAVKSLDEPRKVEAPDEIFTESPDALIADSSIGIVVELMGGIEFPLRFIRKAIEAGKTVVTANKALLAEHGKEIFELAKEKNVDVYFEAAVAGGIPIIKAVREGFVGNHFEAIHGILNGTSNYILTRMTDAGLDFGPALAEAQKLGYAEADPALDVNGWDAAHKAIILASLAYGFWVDPDKVLVDGIEKVTAEDIRLAGELGYRIKLIATVKADERGKIEVRVAPTLIPKEHVLASVNGVFNAVAVKGDVVGETLFYGRGAGQDATASAVIGDLAQAASALISGKDSDGFAVHGLYGRCKPPEEAVSKFYLRLAVEDRPGVLARIAGALGASNIGILSVIQPEGPSEGPVSLVLTLHDARLGDMRRAVETLSALDCVKGEPLLLHMESFL